MIEGIIRFTERGLCKGGYVECTNAHAEKKIVVSLLVLHYLPENPNFVGSPRTTA
jgi:hypothetical protein